MGTPSWARHNARAGVVVTQERFLYIIPVTDSTIHQHTSLPVVSLNNEKETIPGRGLNTCKKKSVYFMPVIKSCENCVRDCE